VPDWLEVQPFQISKGRWYKSGLQKSLRAQKALPTVVQQFKEAKLCNRPITIMQSDILHFLAVMTVSIQWLEQRTRSRNSILPLACCMTWGKAFFTHARR